MTSRREGGGAGLWLLKFHIAFSLLCQLSCIGVRIVFKDNLRRFKKKHEKSKKNGIFKWMIFFCPGINVLVTIGFWYMAFCDDATAELITSQWNK